MSIQNFIPTIWSENLLTALDKQYIAVSNCNRDYEGEIKEKGSSVKICGIGDVTIGNYTKNTDMNDPQTLNDYARELVIDQAKCFNFQIDDVDRAQSVPKLMDTAMKSAAKGLAKEVDKHIYSLVPKTAYYHYQKSDVTENDMLNILLACRQYLYQAGVTDSSDVVLEVSPAIATLIFKAKLDLSTNNQELLENGCIGSFAGCKVYVSNNILSGTEGEAVYYHCVMRSKRSIAFAEQLSEIVAYRPEKRFADAVKGLHLYGAKVIYPAEVVDMVLTLPEVPVEEEE